MGQTAGRQMAIVLLIIVFAITVASGAFGGHQDRVLFRDVSVLTLYRDRMTTGRRSSPVPQLSCVGGTAKGYFTPSVVQCYNRGWDGNDVQWECKSDMDNAFRFGSVEVTCEGYDYPDDPYIFKGSCGLEYMLDLTEEGYQRYKQQKSHSYSTPHGSDYGYSHPGSLHQKGKSVVGNLLFLGGVALVIYVIYKSCIAPSAAAASSTGGTGQAGRGGNPPPYSPPPYGFRQEYMPGCGNDSSTSSGSQGSSAFAGTTNQGGGGGFWSGAATGGILGYMFGRNSGHGGYTQYQRPHYGWGSGWGTGWGSGWGFGSRTSYGSSSSWGGGGGASASSGTRMASGFGGTKRR